MKMSKSKIQRISNIIVILYFVVSVIINTYNLIHEDEAILIFNNLNNIQRILVLGLAILLSFIASLIQNIPIIAIYIGERLVLKKYYKQKLDYNDLKKYEGYYRDLLSEYNVSTLAYIDNFKLDYQSILTAHLLELQNKNMIEIKDNNINIINNPTSEVDKLFVDSVVNNKIVINESKYQNMIINDAINNGLLETQKGNKGKYFKFFFKILFTYFLISFLFTFIIHLFGTQLLENIIFVIILLVILSIFIILSIAFPYLIITYIIMCFIVGNPYIRTKKGTIVNEKLEGLKNFIRDFGNFEDRKSQELELWEEYLIYSVMFNQNKKIIDEYQKFFNY